MILNTLFLLVVFMNDKFSTKENTEFDFNQSNSKNEYDYLLFRLKEIKNSIIQLENFFFSK